MAPILDRGGTPVIFQSYGLTGLPDAGLVAAYEELGRHCDSFIAFELETMFAPFGKIYSLEVYEGLLGVKKCTGAKHSSLRREAEWQRLLGVTERSVWHLVKKHRIEVARLKQQRVETQPG